MSDFGMLGPRREVWPDVDGTFNTELKELGRGAQAGNLRKGARL